MIQVGIRNTGINSGNELALRNLIPSYIDLCWSRGRSRKWEEVVFARGFGYIYLVVIIKKLGLEVQVRSRVVF
jgi:hypothetical protein